jgi:hypothetical protein
MLIHYLERNNRVFTAAIEKLLSILSTWVLRDRSGGLTLELAVKSSSDSRHYYDNIAMHKDYPFKSWDEVVDPVDMALFHTREAHQVRLENRPRHYQSARLALRRPAGFHAAGRYLGSLLRFQGLKSKRLPQVEIINSLLMRHQFKRQICPLALVRLFQESLTHLTSFRLERWCRITTEEEEKYLEGM